jgi:hypothetical protein
VVEILTFPLPVENIIPVEPPPPPRTAMKEEYSNVKEEKEEEEEKWISPPNVPLPVQLIDSNFVLLKYIVLFSVVVE